MMIEIFFERQGVEGVVRECWPTPPRIGDFVEARGRVDGPRGFVLNVIWRRGSCGASAIVVLG